MPYTKQPRIEPLLVILTDKTTLGVLDNPPIQIVDIKELKRIIRRFDREDPEGEMPESDLEQVKSILG